VTLAGPGDGSSAGNPPRLVLWFALASVIGLLFAGGVILFVVRDQLTRQAERQAVDRARVATSAVFQRQLRADDLVGKPSPGRRRQLARLFTHTELGRDAAGVTLYAASGEAVFSTAAAPAPPSVPAHVQTALRGRTVSLVTPDHVLRAFVPLALKTGQSGGVIELDQSFGPTAAEIRRSSVLIAAVLELLLLALCALLLPLLRRTSARLRRHAEEVDRLCSHDEVTGLLNRFGFQRAVAAARGAGTSGALLLVDFAGLAQLKETLGQTHADRLLEQLARRLRQAFPPGFPLARLDESEFGVFVPTSDREHVTEATQRLSDAVAPPLTSDGVRHEVEPRVGTTLVDEDAKFDAVLRHAGAAVSVADGGHGPDIFDPEWDLAHRSRTSTPELRDAVRGGQLVVHYQPQADVATHVIRGVEALVRWQHPERGLVGPGEFIPKAEESGLITEINRFVLETGTRQWREWSSQGFNLDLAINLSTVDLLYPALESEITELLLEHRIPAEYLVLEITERSLFEDLQDARKALSRLNRIGVRLAIDDYGTGYSSLAALRQLPIQQVKIDRSFVTGIPGDAQNDEIVASTVRLAHRLGATVVGEGVETAGELTQLAIHGCDIAQGYLIGPPVPAEELMSVLVPEQYGPNPDSRRLLPAEVSRRTSAPAELGA
jgi:EAL domain-containing protein (putative c-di-GMP-specific phosphodiesterase class I)/GGDEF domain-containing protein